MKKNNYSFIFKRGFTLNPFLNIFHTNCFNYPLHICTLFLMRILYLDLKFHYFLKICVMFIFTYIFFYFINNVSML